MLAIKNPFLPVQLQLIDIILAIDMIAMKNKQLQWVHYGKKKNKHMSVYKSSC